MRGSNGRAKLKMNENLRTQIKKIKTKKKSEKITELRTMQNLSVICNLSYI